MSSVTLVKRTLPTGATRWYARYRDNAGVQRMRLAGVKKKDADKFETELRAELLAEAEGRALPKPDMATTVRDWCEQWVEANGDLRPHIRRDYRRIFAAENGLLAAHGHLPLGALTRAHVRAWMAERAQAGAARYTIRNNLAPVRAALAEAVDDGKLRENPASLTRRRGKKSAVPGKAPRKVTAPEPALVDRVLAATDGEFHAVLLLAAACGLRRGEVYGLQWGDISEDGRTVEVRRSNIRGKLGDPKTETSSRDVPLFPVVRQALLEHKMRSPRKQPDDLMFADVRGLPVNPSTVADRELQAALKRAGLAERAFTFHSLRHFAVTQARRVGKLDLLVCQRIAGHASPDITLRVYSHLFESDIADAADRFDPLSALPAEAQR